MLDSYNRWITSKNWDHLKFLQYLLLIIVLVLLIFIAWILVLSANQIISPDYLQASLRDLGVGFFVGSIAGILVGFGILLPKYLEKEWDLHVVVPYFLLIHLSISVVVMFSTLFLSLPPIEETGIVLGVLIGGMITIVAYAGEVKKEHDEEILIED